MTDLVIGDINCDARLHNLTKIFNFRDMDSLKSEMLSERDNESKLSRCDSIQNSIGEVSSRMSSLKIQRPAVRTRFVDRTKNAKRVESLE